MFSICHDNGDVGGLLQVTSANEPSCKTNACAMFFMLMMLLVLADDNASHYIIWHLQLFPTRPAMLLRIMMHHAVMLPSW